MLKSKLHVGIVFGGMSLEYDISLRSAENIASVIDRDRFVVIMIFVDKFGRWYRTELDYQIDFLDDPGENKFLNFIQYFKNQFNKQKLKFRSYKFSTSHEIDEIFFGLDVIFPIIHGRFGEDGALQGLLKIKQIPFVGTDLLGSAINMDKDISKKLLRAAGFMVAPFITLTDSNIKLDFEYYADVLGVPFFVKPASQGSSIGVSKVIDCNNFYSAVDLAFNVDSKVLIESAIVGRELECAVLGNKYLKISVCGEIILHQDAFYTYESKYSYNQKYLAKVIIPAKVTREINDKIYDVVSRVFCVLHCWGMARIDFFLTSDCHIIINEVNTLPGFSVSSMYPKLWEASGLSCKELITLLIELALESKKEGKKKYFDILLL